MQSIKPVIALCMMLWAFASNGQDGYFFINHFSPSQNGFDNINFDLIQDEDGVIYVANRNGMVRFDGKNWDFVRTESTIFSLALDKEGHRLFTTGRDGFGIVTGDIKQGLEYRALTPKALKGTDIHYSLFHDNKVYGINQQSLFILDPVDTSVTEIEPPYGGSLTGLFRIKGEIFVSNTVSGLLQLTGQSFSEPELPVLKGLHPTFSCAFKDRSKWIIGLENGNLGLLEGTTLSPIDLGNDQTFFNESDLLSGIWINDQLVAIATLKNGVIFLNPQTGKVNQVINYQAGLPDNEVFAILLDREDALWISHKEGLTRVSPDLPFRSFDPYAGLAGDLLSVVTHKDTLYVGTTLGLFYLAEVQDYKDSTYTVKKYVTTKPPGNTGPSQTTVQPTEDKGIFKFLKRKKDKTNSSEGGDSTSQAPPTRKRVVRYEKKIERTLLATRYEYKKVEGINAKVFHLSSVAGRLFCSGLDGLFEIRNATAQKVSATPIRSFYVSTYHNKIFASDYNDLVKVYDLRSLKEVYMFGDFKTYVQHIFEDPEKKVWFCGTNDIFWVQLQAGNIAETKTYPLENPYFYETLGAVRDDSIVFINETGMLYLDPTDDQVKPLPSVKEPKRYMVGSNGQVWFLRDQKWRRLDTQADPDRLGLLSLFKNIHFIFADNSGYLWVITEKNKLFKLPEDHLQPVNSTYNLLLRRVKSEKDNILSTNKFQIRQDHSALVFEFVQPDYSGILDIQYQYRLLGLNNVWSDWSEKFNVIDFAYLPEGDYELNVRSRNIFGSISKIEKVPFKVVAPYWRRPWFYALEFCALALFLFFYARLKKLGYRNRLASRIVALLTLIIVIEFIQTIAENEFQTHTSPIFDFAVQVLVAVIILPVEGLLRKYIFKEKKVELLDFLRVREKNTDSS